MDFRPSAEMKYLSDRINAHRPPNGSTRLHLRVKRLRIWGIFHVDGKYKRMSVGNTDQWLTDRAFSHRRLSEGFSPGPLSNVLTSVIKYNRLWNQKQAQLHEHDLFTDSEFALQRGYNFQNRGLLPLFAHHTYGAWSTRGCLIPSASSCYHYQWSRGSDWAYIAWRPIKVEPIFARAYNWLPQVNGSIMSSHWARMTTAATSMHGYIRHMQRYLHCQPWTASQVVGEQTSRGGREVEEKGDREREIMAIMIKIWCMSNQSMHERRKLW